MLTERLAGIDARAKLAFLIAFMVAALHAHSAFSLACCLAVAICLSVAFGLSRPIIHAAILPLIPIVLFTVLLQLLSYQEGAVLAQVGGVNVTEMALAASARMIACLLALVLASVSFMRCTRAEELLFTLEWLLRPLAALGLRSDALVLSLSVTLGALPVLFREFQKLKAAQIARHARFDGSLAARLRAYFRLFAPLFRSSFSHADCMADAFLTRAFSAGPRRSTLYEGRFGWGEGACLAAAAIVCAVCFA